jgi:membrane protein required for colicin V production
MFHTKLEVLLVDTIQQELLRTIAASSMLFIATLMVGSLINMLISQLVKMTGLSGTDRALGMVFGFFRGLIVVIVLVMLLPPLLKIDQQAWWQESVLIPHLLTLEDGIKKLAGEVMGVASQINS